MLVLEGSALLSLIHSKKHYVVSCCKTAQLSAEPQRGGDL